MDALPENQLLGNPDNARKYPKYKPPIRVPRSYGDWYPANPGLA